MKNYGDREDLHNSSHPTKVNSIIVSLFIQNVSYKF